MSNKKDPNSNGRRVKSWKDEHKPITTSTNGRRKDKRVGTKR